MSIANNRHKGLRRLWEDGDRRGMPAQSANKIRRILAVLNRTTEPSDMAAFPGWRLHPVTGNRRIVFRFENGQALDVDLIDYH